MVEDQNIARWNHVVGRHTAPKGMAQVDFTRDAKPDCNVALDPCVD